LHQLTIGRVKGLYRAKGQAFGPADGHGITGKDASAFELRNHEELKTDGAAAGDEYGFASGNAGFLHRFDDGVDGLDEGGFFKADVIGKGHDTPFGNPRHGFDVLREAAAIGREAAGKAGGLVLLALGEEAVLAVEALTTRDVVKAHHP